MSIYQPAEDSFLLQKTLKQYLNTKKKDIKNISILDMGSGSGIQALTCKKLGFKNITAVDINPEAIKHIKQQDKTIKITQSDLFSNIKTTTNKKQKFNLIIFNPPYLPEDKREPKESQLQTTAGKKGYEIIIKFLKQAKPYLTNNKTNKGTILLLFSSLSKPRIILKKVRELNYNYKLLNQQSLPFFEEIFVYEFTKKT